MPLIFMTADNRKASVGDWVYALAALGLNPDPDYTDTAQVYYGRITHIHENGIHIQAGAGLVAHPDNVFSVQMNALVRQVKLIKAERADLSEKIQALDDRILQVVEQLRPMHETAMDKLNLGQQENK